MNKDADLLIHVVDNGFIVTAAHKDGIKGQINVFTSPVELSKFIEGWARKQQVKGKKND